MPNPVITRPHALTIDRSSASDDITISPIGVLRYSDCFQMRREIQSARSIGKRVLIDLSEVTLVDRGALEFVRVQQGESVALINCPIHLQKWIMSAQAGSSA